MVRREPAGRRDEPAAPRPPERAPEPSGRARLDERLGEPERLEDPERRDGGRDEGSDTAAAYPSPPGPKTKNEAPKGLVQGEIRRRPTLPGSLLPSTIGAGGLNFRVRDGNGCDPTAMATEICCQERARSGHPEALEPLKNSTASTNVIVNPSPRPISTGRLNTSPCLHLRPINVVIWPRALPGYPVGDLI